MHGRASNLQKCFSKYNYNSHVDMAMCLLLYHITP